MDPNKVSVVQAQLFLEEMGSGVDKFLDLMTVQERKIMIARWINRPENTYGLCIVGTSVRRVIHDNDRWFAYMARALRPIIRIDSFVNRTYNALYDTVAGHGGVAAEWIDTLPMFLRLRGLCAGDPEEFRSELWRFSRLDDNVT